MVLANKGIIRKFPAVPDIDLAGIVVESSSPAYKAGDQVVLPAGGSVNVIKAAIASMHA